MSAGTYIIRSKLKPAEILFKGTSNDLAKSIEYHKFYLIKRIHPNPILMNHTQLFGVSDLEFIIDPFDEKETATLKVNKEKRRRIAET